MLRMKKDLIALFSGVLLVAAFAPFYYFYLAIAALVSLLWTWLHATPLRAAWRGLLFGLGLFGEEVEFLGCLSAFMFMVVQMHCLPVLLLVG
jgi:apolipoprotein N-acyltransferase